MILLIKFLKLKMDSTGLFFPMAGSTRLVLEAISNHESVQDIRLIQVLTRIAIFQDITVLAHLDSKFEIVNKLIFTA